MKNIILLGNGPSRKYYKKSQTPVAGFNFCEEEVDYKFVSDNSVRSDNCIRLPKKKFGYNKGILLAWNTGHAAYSYLRSQGFDSFDFFGFDLMWENTWDSETDKVKNKDSWVIQANNADLRDHWNSYWGTIIDVPTRIHLPSGESLNFHNKHIRLQHYE